MDRLNKFVSSKWAPIITLLFIVLAIGVVLTQIQNQNINNIRQIQVASCNRANRLRTENNRRINSHKIDTRVLSEFLDSARIARLATYTHGHQTSDLHAARQYQHLRNDLRKVTFRKVPLVNCVKVIDAK